MGPYNISHIILAICAARLVAQVLGFPKLRIPFLNSCSSRRRKSNPQDYFLDPRDRISRLPDDLLISIMSRLDVKDAVKTSGLCRRWEFLYSRLPCVSFSCTPESKEIFERRDKNFVEHVDEFLCKYSGPKMVSFRLICSLMPLYDQKLETWLHLVCKMGVEVLVLDLLRDAMSPFPHECECVLPDQPFSHAAELHELFLRGCILPWSFVLRTNNLKKLLLHWTSIPSGVLEGILSSCLGLEVLLLKRCNLIASELCISGSTLKLKQLTIDRCDDVKEIEIHCSSLRVLEARFRTTINFSSVFIPNLEILFLSEYSMRTLPAVFNDLDVRRRFPHLKSLMIENGYLIERNVVPERLKIHENLRTLCLVMDFGLERDPFDLVTVLAACPSLETFICSYRDYFYDDEEGGEACGGGVAVDWRSSKLKAVEFWGFNGKHNELEFACYLLRNAAALERMMVRFDSSRYLGGGEWQYRKGDKPFNPKQCQEMRRLFRVHAASPDVKIMVQEVPLVKDDDGEPLLSPGFFQPPLLF